MTLPATRYHLFGGCLSSDLDFANLCRAAPDAAIAWRLHVVDAIAPARPTTVLRAERLGDELLVTISDTGVGLRVSFSDTGDFDLTDAGRSITWYRHSTGHEAEARLDVLGTLLPLALHLGHQLTLHGSAVAFDSGVVAFLAPSGFGKSTLATSLTIAGARLMSDDALPVRVRGGIAFASPGVPSPRLREDTFPRFRDALSADAVPSNGKLSPGAKLPDEMIVTGDRPLSAIYVLHPVSRDVASQLERSRVPPMLATMELVRHAKLAKLLWADESSRLLGLVSDVTRCVPVWNLAVPRDLELLPRVVDQLLEWHGVPLPQTA